ncbi:hypothetical protein HHI36_012960 [Cryptolaemus montrouzieri]|uniref:Uncharacterized protein n=1 Tax=Cryptolaemus montrouzieri TaxID=559131 RepID=A0ABD2NGF0_9CUCU
MSQKRPSGSEFRKRKRVREMESKKWEIRFESEESQPENSQKEVSNHKVLVHPGMSGTRSENNLKIEYKEDSLFSPFQQDLTLPITTSPSSEIQIEEAAATDKIQLDINDPVSWLLLIDHIRCFLVEKGPDQGEGSQNISSTEDAGRKFHMHWFTIKQIMTALADAQKGFNDWRHLSPHIHEHENYIS